MLKIVYPAGREHCQEAANVFASLYRQITDVTPALITEAEDDCDLVVIGGDDENVFTHKMIMEAKVPAFRIRYGTDDYHLYSIKENDRRILFLVGGNTRALFYAVYDYFETYGGCSYFWDGDIIPKAESLPMEDIDRAESSRFQYRGLRYFAHRSLTRFQAEHWDLDDWKKELDWLLKKRFNLYMLRIGIDDIFQKTFPDIVPYPKKWEPIPEAIDRSYDDRNLFWSLEYRGQLRKEILSYGRKRGLMHPEDCGTMTHWYSRTPQAFLDAVKPGFVPQANKNYREQTGLVWDICQDKNMDNYFKLTQTHIKEYGSPELFHTIGLAERVCYPDRKRNQELKLYAYRRIENRVHKEYPNAPLLLASWDFQCFWDSEEVPELLRTLNPANTILFDYTSDTASENNFTKWLTDHNFRWIFGIFQALEASNEVRGNYPVIEQRLAEAVKDPLCIGMIMWPEQSHADTLMLEYHAANSWRPEHIAIKDFLKQFCRKRYRMQRETISAAWQTMLPLIREGSWGTTWFRDWENCRHSACYPDFVYKPLTSGVPLMRAFDARTLSKAKQMYDRWVNGLHSAPESMRILASLNWNDADDFLKRDAIDLARTATVRLGNFLACDIALRMEQWRKNTDDNGTEILRRLDALFEVVHLLHAVVSAHKDFSLWESLLDLQRKQETNPAFEHTLKGNANNTYCRTMIAELFPACYFPELQILKDRITKEINAGNRADETFVFDEKEVNAPSDHFFATPLKEFAPDFDAAYKQLPQTIARVAELMEQYC